MYTETHEIINDFNDLCEYAIVEKNESKLCIKDLQLNEFIETTTLEWLEKIYDYYTVEVFNQNDLWIDKNDLEWLEYYYSRVLETVRAIRKEKDNVNA